MPILHAATRPRDDYDADPIRFTVEADDYHAAIAQVRAQVPAGSVLLHVIVDR